MAASIGFLKIARIPQFIVGAHNKSTSSQVFTFPLQRGHRKLQFPFLREYHTAFAATCALSPELVDVAADAPSMEGTSVDCTTTEDRKIKMKVEVSGAKSEAIFEDVFSKMVSAAQPIPGFRRVKGGKTPNIPRNILIEILGPTKVYKQVIKKIINSTVAEYVEKEQLRVSKDLRVEQSYEELEAAFEPGEAFSFNVTIQLEKKYE